MAIRFRDCVLDRDARALVRDGLTVHLTPKAFEVLALLVSERPRALKKAEILDRVWPGTFVTDASLTRTIHEIRDAIGDERLDDDSHRARPRVRVCRGGSGRRSRS